jgi:hypothetical protein
MGQELCKLKNDLLQGDFEQYVQLVSCPQFICTKCGRAANASQNLCAPCPIRQKAPRIGKQSLIDEILAIRRAAAQQPDPLCQSAPALSVPHEN